MNTLIDEILGQLVGRASVAWDKDRIFDTEEALNAANQAKSELLKAILDVVGDDEEVPLPRDEESRARFYRKSGQNFIRQELRTKLTELFEGK